MAKQNIARQGAQSNQAPINQPKSTFVAVKRRRRKLRNRRYMTPDPFTMYNGTMEYLPNQTRSGRRPNPADPRTVLSQTLGNTRLGSCAALKMLHPCGEYDLAKIKIPDGAVSTSVSLERRDEYEINVPTTIGTATSWNCLVIHQPFLNHRDIVLRWPSSTTLPQSTIYDMLSRINDENIEGATPTVAIYPEFSSTKTLTGASTAAAYVATEYSVLTSSTLTPALLADPVNVTQLMKDVRRSALGYTTDLDASQLYNQGRVISGQWSPSITLATNDPHGNVAAAGGTGTTSVVIDEYDTYAYSLPAVTSSTIVSSDMFRRQAEAKYGSYMPIRLCTPKIDFTSSEEYRQIQSYSPGAPATDDNTGSRASRDLWMRGWSVGVELWLNLDPHAELRIKVVEDLELDPAPSSTFSPFMSPGYPQDDYALSIVREFSRISPHAYDADFNRLNKLATNLLNGLAGVVSNLGIPVLSSIAKPGMNLLMNKFGYQQPQYNNTPQPLD